MHQRHQRLPAVDGNKNNEDENDTSATNAMNTIQNGNDGDKDRDNTVYNPKLKKSNRRNMVMLSLSFFGVMIMIDWLLLKPARILLTGGNPSSSPSSLFSSTKNIRRNQNNNNTAATATTATTLATKMEQQQEKEHSCPSYGCSIYPPEITDEDVLDAIRTLNNTNTNNKKKTTDNNNSSFDFGSWSMASLTKQGNGRHMYNQDTTIVIRPFVTKATTTLESSVPFLVGIFDGHGEDGHIVSQYVAKAFPELLAKRLNDCCGDFVGSDGGGGDGDDYDQWIKDQLHETFAEADNNAPPSAMRGGCTGSVTLRIGSKLYFANAGDSRTILVQPATAAEAAETSNHDSIDYHIRYATRLDKPNVPEEKERIEALGGRVAAPNKNNPNFFRVFIRSSVFQEGIGLAMTRTIGDWEWKPIGVISDPVVDVVDLNEYHYDGGDAENEHSSRLFLIAASDGLWDTRPKMNFYARHFTDQLYDNRKHNNIHPIMACYDAIKKAAGPERKPPTYRDDISVIIMKI